MINEVTVQGSKDTTFHDFTISQEGMDISFSVGSYYRGGRELAKEFDITTITIDTPAEDVQLEIWLGADSAGVAEFMLCEAGSDLSALTYPTIDRLAWFTLPAGTTSLDVVEINVLKITA